MIKNIQENFYWTQKKIVLVQIMKRWVKKNIIKMMDIIAYYFKVIKIYKIFLLQINKSKSPDR